jgi:hypothetical protein
MKNHFLSVEMRIDAENPLPARLLVMYANPVVNKLKYNELKS